MIKAIIVDDELYCCETLTLLLNRYCPQVQISAICHSGASALHAIQDQPPDLLFLDIEMPQMNGFQLLERFSKTNFELIFTTSYNQYAIKAFKFSALDYLLKPIDREELQKAVQKAEQRLRYPLSQQMEILLQQLKQPMALRKVALPTMEGLHLIALDAIISCTSDSNYTIFSLKDKQKLVVSRTLKEVEEMLRDYAFLRVHHSHLVNLNEVVKYLKGEGGYLEMSDGSVIDVSRSRKEALLKRLMPRKC